MSYTVAIDETARGLLATWRMFLRDPRAAQLFENSYAGAVRSYWAVAIILPVYLLVLAIEYAVPAPHHFNFGKLVADAGFMPAVLAEFAIFTLCWFVAWPLVVDRLAGFLDCERNFLRYVAAYNWMHVLYAMVGLIFWTGKLTGLVHDGNSLVFSLTLLAGLWTYHWFVLRHALGVNGGFATLLVAFEYIFILMLKDLAISIAL